MTAGKIRPLQKNDLSLILGWRNQESVRNNMYSNSVISLDEHIAWFDKIKADDTCLCFIYEQEEKPLGVISFSEINKANNSACWAFYSGDTSVRGVGTSMENIALEYSFKTLKLNKLWCEVLDFNLNVVKFHRKFGFMQEGVLRQHYKRGDNYHDIYRLAIFKKDWEKNQVSIKKLQKSYIWEFKFTKETIREFEKLSGEESQINVDDEATVAQRGLVVAEISKVFGMRYPGQGTIFLSESMSLHKPLYADRLMRCTLKLVTQINRFVILSVEISDAENGESIASGESELLLPKSQNK